MHDAVLADGKRWRIFGLAVVFGHLTAISSTAGLRPEHWLIDGIYLVCMLCGGYLCRLAVLSLPFWLVAVTYSDLLPLALPFRGAVHVADLYNAELLWFGMGNGSARAIVPEFFREHHWAIVDLICGPVYLCVWMEMIPFALYLAWRDPARLSRLMWTYLLTHLAGFATWVLYPAAPPWYVEKYGLGEASMTAVSNAAGLSRLDQILGIDLVQGLYGRSVNVFGAMPSLHIGAATVFVFIAAGMSRAWFIGACLFAAIMTFGSVYFRHHYILDAVAGAGYACAAYAAVTLAERLIHGSVCAFPVSLSEQVPCELNS